MNSDQTHKYFRKFVRVCLYLLSWKRRLMRRDGMMELYGKGIMHLLLGLLLLAPALRGQFPQFNRVNQ